MYPASGSQSNQIVNETSAGAGWITYTAHGDWNLWYDPSFSIANINSLQNTGKYAFASGQLLFDKSNLNIQHVLVRHG